MTTTTQSPVADAIDAARRDRGGALIGYLPAGFPDLDTSVEAAVAVLESGFDVLEFGMPYSDPVMDGPSSRPRQSRRSRTDSASRTCSRRSAACGPAWTSPSSS